MAHPPWSSLCPNCRVLHPPEQTCPVFVAKVVISSEDAQLLADRAEFICQKIYEAGRRRP